tara:strand:- start:11112 stop:11975 length:864 start_codon:yes stop_codon:yes gene_type:complete
MYNINIGFVWILIYLIIRQRYIGLLSRYQNPANNSNNSNNSNIDPNIPASPCGYSNHEECLLNAFIKPDSPSNLTLKEARINCCNEVFKSKITNSNNPSSYSDAKKAMSTSNIQSSNCKCNPNAPKVTNPAGCINISDDDKKICIDNCINKSTTNSSNDDTESRCKHLCCHTVFNECIKESSTEECIDKINITRSSKEKAQLYCDCPNKITQQVCPESNNLECIKAGLASSTCNTIEHIVKLCNDNDFITQFNKEETNGSNPPVSFYKASQYYDKLNKNKLTTTSHK